MNTKKNWKDILTEKKIMFDVINVLLGLAVIVLIVLLFLFPNNIRLVSAAIGAGGALNILNGYRQLNGERNHIAGKSMITTGSFLLVAAMILLFLL